MSTRCPSCLNRIESSVCPRCGYPSKSMNESHQLPVGTLLRGRYQIGKVLGQGGFGITYLTWDTLMRMPVAVKEFYPNGMVFRRSNVSLTVECSTDKLRPHFESSKKRFLREASALVEFRGIPEIVNILDFVEENNTAYIIMEYVKGASLEKYIARKGGKLSVEETFRILKPVMEALAKVHESGIVHRDISPDNIILDPTGGAKLLDFGAVRGVENPDVDKMLTKSTEAILKRGFAPMEQYNTHGSLGPWTDEYAMCATIWYCLTGTVPPEASLRMTEGVDPDWSSIPGLSEHQQRALEKGLSLRPRERYERLDGLIAALIPEGNATKDVTLSESAFSQTISLPSARKQRENMPKYAPIFRNKILWITAVLAVIIVAAVIGISRLPENRYNKAQRLMERGEYFEAWKIFEGLENYLDARERSLSCWNYFRPLSISAGEEHTVGLRADGMVVAVGNNGVGQCQQVSIWHDIMAISAGDWHTVGLKADGTVVAVGYNGDGQCNVSRWRNIVAISAGASHTVGLKSDGTVVAVGWKEHDQCDVSWWRDIVAISAGARHTVGLKADGTVVAVGDNEDYQCEVSGWHDIVAISAGENHTVGLKADGTVVTAGENKNGQCEVSEWREIVAISAGDYYTVGLKADGTIVSAGWNQYGQCDVSEWRDIVAITTGRYHIVGLKADGTVVAVGWNEEGQCDVSEWRNIRIYE